ncbi:hypothetical protein LJC15_05480, partial [Desulfovibrio sp. OttesenSCG-928-G11]|nr:hypothetical protein [Desulfovibrio sp. OttesenSCG-928-G11]
MARQSTPIQSMTIKSSIFDQDKKAMALTEKQCFSMQKKRNGLRQLPAAYDKPQRLAATRNSL